MNRVTPDAAASTEQLPRPHKRRRALIAAPLSLLVPGVGQFYNGNARRAAAFLGIAVALEIAMVALMAMPPQSIWIVAGGFAIVAGSIVFRIVAMVDAARTARRLGAIVLKPWNRPLVYVAVLVAGAVLMIAPNALFGDSRLIHAYRLPSGSMSPTVLYGERFMTWRGYYADRPPERGDLAIFKLPRDQTTDYLKRVVGLPGDRIQMVRGVLHINGEPVKLERLGDWGLPDNNSKPVPQFAETLPGGRMYRIIEYTDRGEFDDTPVLLVPASHYFVLGDNRDNSLDSRVPPERYGVGFVPRQNLRDRPTFVFWSTNWGRIGAVLD